MWVHADYSAGDPVKSLFNFQAESRQLFKVGTRPWDAYFHFSGQVPLKEQLSGHR